MESEKKRYIDKVGKKMKDKEEKIREGVIVIKKEKKMQEIEKFEKV